MRGRHHEGDAGNEEDEVEVVSVLHPQVEIKGVKNDDAENAVKKAEAAVEKFHKEQQELEQQLADPAIYADENKEQLKKLLSRKSEVDNALEQAEIDWMTAEENLSQAE